MLSKIFTLVLIFVISVEIYSRYRNNNIDSTNVKTNSNEDTLVIVDNKIITCDDFISSYKEKLTRIGLTDNGETRLGYLMNLVNDELFIAEAKNKGLDKTEAAKKEYKRICLQELLNAYTIKYISPTINVTENDLQDLFTKLNTKIKVSHLYAPTKDKADLLYKELISGKKFEDLAKENFFDPELRNNGGSLGYISVDEMDPEFEKAAYSMRVGEISQPVKTVQGYSIIRVEDDKQIPLDYNVSQNYPNPFNPSTIVKYSIPNHSLVQIRVYDITGSLVKTLFNAEQNTGKYEVVWNGLDGVEIK